MKTEPTPSSPSTPVLDSKKVEELETTGMSYIRTKLGKFWGHEVCRLGSPFTLALALFTIGILSSLQILPLGIQLTQTCYTFGLLVFLVTFIRDRQKKESQWILASLAHKKDAKPFEV